MVPRTLSLAIAQINLVVTTIIASTLESGSLAIFNFANNLQSFPIGIFGISFAVAAFPTLSVLAFNRKELVRNFSLTIRQILFFIIPATVMLLTLRAQIIRVIFGTGQFDWNDTVLTIDTLGFFSISLFAQATIPLLVRMFYARHNSKTPFYIGLISASANVFLAYWFSWRMGVDGLALAFSISSILNFIFLWLFLHIELEDMDELKILYSVIKFSIAGLAAGVAVQATKIAIWPFVDMTKTVGVFSQGFIAGLAGVFVYLLISAFLRTEELFSFWSSIRRRLLWKKIQTGDQGEARGI
jgi:putative peptidoglycan lipid II flippase